MKSIIWSKNMGEHVAVDDLTLTVEPWENLWFSRTEWCRKIHDNEYDYRIPWRDERRGEDQRSRYFCRSAGGKKMRGVFAGDTAALYGDDGAEYLDFVAELKGLDKKVRKTQTEEIMELTHTEGSGVRG